MHHSLKNRLNELRRNLYSVVPAWPAFYFRHIYKSSPLRLSGRLFQFSKKLQHQVNFIQIGANDGINNDPLYKFIIAFHWRGLRLEPQQFVFEKLKKLHQNTIGITPLQCAIGPENGKATMYKVAFSNKRWAHGLTTFNRETLLHELEKELKIGQGKIKGERVPADKNAWIETIEVEQRTYTDILAQASFGRYDLLAIDAEGYDYELLKIAFEADVLPRAVLFEHINFDEETAELCANLLADKGYSVQQYGANSFAERL
ncbi:FkbM family methyltransferase [bacterium]|nr:FkbM family methyltransferase [bacterium]